MCLVSLDRKGVIVISGIKRRTYGRAAGTNRIAIEQAVDPIFIKVFVDADAVLLGVIVTRRIKVTLVKHRRVTRYIVSAGSAAASVCGCVLRPERLLGGLKYIPEGRIARWVLGQQLHFRTTRLRGLCEVHERRIFVGLQ